MQKTEGKKTRVTLEDARRTKGKSNLAKIVAEQRKEQLIGKKKNNH